MKILQIIQRQQLRGAEVFAAQLSSHIIKSGHQSIMVALFPGTETLPFDGTIYSAGASVKKRMFDVDAWKKLATIIKKEQPDVIQANAGDTLKYAVCSKLMFGWQQPIVFRNASTVSLYIKSKVAKKWHGFFFKQAQKIISVSNASAKDFATLYPAYKNKIVTIPIGIETSEAAPWEKQKHSSGVLVHVGGFTHEKNHIGLINIFEKLLHERSNLTLQLVGDGPLKKSIEHLVEQKNLAGKVQFLGFQKNAMDYIKSADVLLLPSLIEGLPGVILEAFYCKTPVVAYNVGGIGEALKNNETGRLVALNNEDQFCAAVLASLDDNNTEMIEHAYALVNKYYANKTIAQTFLNTYASLI